jgi:hypothetical protein
MTDAAAGTLADLIAEMHRKRSVLRGWDAVLNLSENAINDVLANGWPAGGGHPGEVVWREDPPAGPISEPGGQSAALIRVDFSLGPPVLTLGAGAAVSIRQDILTAEIRRGIVDRAGLDVSAANWSGSTPLAVTPATRLAGTAALVFAADPAAEGRHSLFLDLSGPDWTIEGAQALALDTGALALKLRDRLAPDQTRPVIVSIDFDTDPGAPSLTPSSVTLNRPRTDSGPGIVQLLIATRGGPPGGVAPGGLGPDGAGTDVANPIPAADGASYSLMIGSGNVIPEIVEKFNGGTGLVKLVAVPPEASATSWFAQTRNAMQYSGSISADGAFPPIESQAELHMRFAGSKDEGLALATYVSPSSNIQPQLVLSATYPISVTGEGARAKIALGAKAASVQAAGVAENAVKPRLEQFLNGDIAADMSAITLDVVSTFALQTISLPGSLLELRHVAMPGDLLITGTILRTEPPGPASR